MSRVLDSVDASPMNVFTDNLVVGITCEDSFDTSNKKYPQLTNLEDIVISYSYDAYIADDIDHNSSLIELDGIINSFLAFKSGLMTPSGEAADVDCNMLLRESLGALAGALDIPDDDNNIEFDNRHSRTPVKPSKRLQAVDAFDDAWIDILGIKTSTPGVYDSDHECSANEDVPNALCRPILASITAQVPASKAVDEYVIQTLILRGIQQAVLDGNFTTDSIPALTFVGIREDDIYSSLPGQPAKITTFQTPDKTFTAFGVLFLGLLAGATFIALVLLLVRFRRYNRDNKVKELISPSSIDHYPITGDSSESTNNIPFTLSKNTPAMKEDVIMPSSSSRNVEQVRSTASQINTDMYENTWKSMLSNKFSGTMHKESQVPDDGNSAFSNEKLQSIEMVKEESALGSVNLIIDEESIDISVRDKTLGVIMDSMRNKRSARDKSLGMIMDSMRSKESEIN